METYKQQFLKAKKAKTVKELTPQLFKFKEPGDELVGVYVSQSVVGVEDGSEGYNQYVFETDDGLVKVGPGRGFDNDVAGQLAAGILYAIEYLGKASTNRGFTVNKFNVMEIGKPEYSEAEPQKPKTSGKAVDQE